MRIYTIIASLLLAYACVAVDAEGTRPTKNDDAIDKSGNRDKRNSEYAGISHHASYPRDPRLERRISNVPLSTTAQRMYPAFFPSGMRPYTYYRKQKPALPPYAVQMEPLTQYSQRDPLYDPSLGVLPQPHNELTKPDDQTPDNNHLSESYYGPPRHQYIERPVYIKEPEPIIEIIIKEANTTAPPAHQEVIPLPPKKKKEEVQVFYVKYKKNPHGTGKDSVIYDKPIPALTPLQDHDEEPEEPHHHEAEYAAPTYAPPVATTTIRAIIKPDSETFHADSGIHVTFGGAAHNPHAETYSHDDDIVESAPQPALSHPEGRRFPNNNGPTTTTFTQEYKPEQRLPQPYRPFNFNSAAPQQHNANQRPHNFHQQAPPQFNAHNFNAPPPTLSNVNSQLFNSPVPNRFPPGSFNARPNFGPPLKQGPPLHLNKPYQFERPQQFTFPRQQTHFPVHQQQPPTPQNPVIFSHKPNFQNGPPGPGPVTKFTQPSPQSFHLSQQLPNHQPQQVFHQGTNAFSFQTNFAEPTSFNNHNNNNQAFQGNHHQFQQSYQTIQQPRPALANQQFPQQQHQQQQHQHQHQQANNQQHQHSSPPKPLQIQSNLNSHHQPQAQSLPLVQNFNHQQFSNNQNFHVTDKQQHQQQQQQQQQHQLQQNQLHQNQQLLNQHKHIIPPGGELIPALPKYEQHITSQYPAGSGSEDILSPQNFSTQIQQQFRDFPSQQQQQSHLHIQQQPINHNFNIQSQSHFEGQKEHEQIIQQSNNNHHQSQSQSIQSSRNAPAPAPAPTHNLQNHNFDFNPNQNYYKVSTQSTTPSSYVTSPRPSSTTRLQTTTPPTTTTTTPKPESTTLNLKDLNIELPDEVPDDLREQLLSSGILKNAQISVLDYDKVGDIPISALPPDQLANFYGAGGAQQLASGSEAKPTILRPDGSSVRINDEEDEVDEMEPIAQASTMTEVRAPESPNKQAVEMKVVRYDPETEQGQQVHDSYVKEGATQIQPVVLNDQSYNRYLPLKVSGTKFPIPDVPELKGKNINSVVVLAPVDYNFYKQRVVRAAAANLEDDIQLIKNDALKKLVKEPTKENYKSFLDHEKQTSSAQQSVILLVTGSEPENREIFMYDVTTMSVSKLDGELSAAFVDAAESNTSEAREEAATAAASNLVETKVPAPEGLDATHSHSAHDDDMELQPAASELFETRVPIIDPMMGDLEAEGSEQLEQFVDVSGMQPSADNEDLMPAASDEHEQTIFINSGYSKTEYQMPSP